MQEIKAILRAYEEAMRQGKRTALATVVQVEGSSYRRPGARMLVTDDGQLTGAISGGCLEGDALRKAQNAIAQGQNKLVVYDTTDGEDDLKFGVQLGCNGVVSILFEPSMEGGKNSPMNFLRQSVEKRQEGVLVTLFGKGREAIHTGTCGYQSIGQSFWKEGVEAEIKSAAATAFHARKSAVQEAGAGHALFQFVAPPAQVLVAGAGNDAQPVVEMAALLGWEIFVVDGRATHATMLRFPHAEKVIVSKPETALLEMDMDVRTAAVLMTHNYHYDLALLEKLLETPCAYIGILGPKAKATRMLDELAAKGISLTEEQVQKIHGPVGLDIGAEGAAEIALSILSGITAAFNNRSGGELKHRETAIHQGL